MQSWLRYFTSVRNSRNLHVTVVITGLNEEDNIGRCLESLSQQSYSNYDVIYIDGGSTDATVNIAREFSKCMPLRVIVAAKSTPSQARNIGILNAKGDIVAIIDADCAAPPDWLEKIVTRLINSGSDTAGVGGPYIPPPELPKKVHIIFDALDTFLCGGSFTVQFSQGRSGLKVVEAVPAGNSAYWTHVLKEVGGFNENLIYCEDHDLGIRINSIGKKILFDPPIYVYHYSKVRGFSSLFRLMLSYGEGRVQAIFCNRRLFSVIRMVPLIFMISAILLLIASIFLINLRVIFLILILTYLFTLLLGTARLAADKKDPQYLLSFVVYLIVHFSYGIGMLLGLLKYATSARYDR